MNRKAQTYNIRFAWIKMIVGQQLINQIMIKITITAYIQQIKQSNRKMIFLGIKNRLIN